MFVERTTTQLINTFEEGCRAAGISGKIVICTASNDTDTMYLPHPKVLLIIKNSDEVWLNDDVMLYKGEYTEAIPHPEGCIILHNNKLVVYDGKKETLLPPKRHPFIDWIPCASGAALMFGDELWLNGTRLVYRGEANCSMHFNGGLIIQTPDSFLWIPA